MNTNPIIKNNYLTLDIETDGLDWQKDPIVAIGTKDNTDSKAVGKIWGEWDFDWQYLKNNYTLLVGHNISFDLKFLWKYEELQDWFKQGGRIWDTQLVHYMLSGQQEKYSSLREIAVRDYGCPERTKWIDDLLFNKKETLQKLEEQINKLGDACFEDSDKLCKLYRQVRDYEKVSDLPKDKVLEDVQNDVLDTEQVYLQQLELVKARGKNFENLVLLEHDALLATTEATVNGMFVVKQKLLENKEELEKQLVEKQAELMQIVGRYWK